MSIAQHSQSLSPELRAGTRRFTRWRVRSLIAVHLLIVAHITHWVVSGRSLAPLELHEVMYTLELGIVTAGAVFMLFTVLVTAVFGRFFCSWACHILALQDLAAALLRRLGLKPRPLRSRLLLWVPLGVMAYMFLWPQAKRLLAGEGLPSFRILDDEGGWASFMTTEFWRNLPGWGVAAATLISCGFGFVYLLGSRSFCRYVCPYGAVFGLVDRLAPGRIRSRDACTQCGVCTAVCDSGIRVHEETERFGMVVSPGCLRDLDCVAACPHGNLHFGLGRPSLAKTVWKERPVRRIFDFSLGEDLLMLGVFLPTLFIVRGLYDLLPFFLSLVLAVAFGYACVLLRRLSTDPAVALSSLQLKRKGGLTPAGRGFLLVFTAVSALWVHSAYVHYQSFAGLSGLAEIRGASPPERSKVTRALAHLEKAERWSLISMKRVRRGLTLVYAAAGRFSQAEARARAMVSESGHDPEMRICLAQCLSGQGRAAEAIAEYRPLVERFPERLDLHYALARQLFVCGRLAAASRELEACVRLNPKAVAPRVELGAILVELGRPEDGLMQLRRAIACDPRRSDSFHNLAVALHTLGRYRDALRAVNTALSLKPGDEVSTGFRDHLIHLIRQQENR